MAQARSTSVEAVQALPVDVCLMEKQAHVTGCPEHGHMQRAEVFSACAHASELIPLTE
jgi:stage III sporulation protein SpoIIIAA